MTSVEVAEEAEERMEEGEVTQLTQESGGSENPHNSDEAMTALQPTQEQRLLCQQKFASWGEQDQVNT